MYLVYLGEQRFILLFASFIFYIPGRFCQPTYRRDREAMASLGRDRDNLQIKRGFIFLLLQ